MSSTVSPCDATALLGSLMKSAGAVAWGVSQAGDVSSVAREAYLSFIAAGHHADMDYLARNLEARFSTSLILSGARSIISAAFAYPDAPPPCSPRHPRWAAYALGDDYHEVIRRRLSTVAAEIDRMLGSVSRVCVDTAPVMERYRAVKAGVGFRGRNGMVIVPGVGARVFLAEIFTTAELPASEPCAEEIACADCGRCVASCPCHALQGDGTLDARRCLSYLTIEHRGDLPPDTPASGYVYGCDICRLVCPHEYAAFSAVLPEFQPRESILSLTVDDISRLTPEDFSTIFRKSAVKRTKLLGLLRNVKLLLKDG